MPLSFLLRNIFRRVTLGRGTYEERYINLSPYTNLVISGDNLSRQSRV
jgi:hypothetical protein